MPPATEEVTLSDVMAELQAQRKEIQRLREEVEGEDELVRIRDFAEEKGVSPRTIYRKARKRNIPIRDDAGFPKEEGDRSAAFISRTEWEEKEKLDTRTVRRRAGAYD
jgi:predicted DNA-binding transcriptional regulator AlpA